MIFPLDGVECRQYKVDMSNGDKDMTSKQKEIMAVIERDGSYCNKPYDMPAIRSLRSKGLIKQAPWPDLNWIAA
jgi:hypothetical protein